MELNLRPASVVRARETAARIPCLVLAGACLLAILAGWWIYFLKATEVQTAVSEQLQAKISGLQAMEAKFNSIRATIKAKQQIVAPLVEAVENREYWVRLIEDLNTRLPEQSIWVTSMELEAGRNEGVAKTPKNPEIILKGLWLANPRGVNIIDDFSASLQKSPFYTVEPEKNRTPQSTEDWATEYTLRLSLKKPSAP